jgi:hypothetical protein
VAINGFLIATQYYSPSNPNGDSADLNSVVLIAMGSGGDWTWDQSARRSGLLPVGLTDATNAPVPVIGFDPTSNGGCHVADPECHP